MHPGGVKTFCRSPTMTTLHPTPTDARTPRPDQPSEAEAAPAAHGPVGVAGLGAIGSTFVARLVAAGRAVIAFDPQADRLAQAAAAGARPAASLAELVAGAGVVVLCLPGSKQVERAVPAVLASVATGQLWINASTCHPETDERCAALIAARGGAWVDAPLTWRPEGFVFMLGGEPEACARAAAAVLDVVGARSQRFGPTGTGQKCKLMQQAITAAEKAVRLEVAALSRALGLDPAWLRDYLGVPLSPALLEERPGAGATLGMMYKDLGYFLQVAHDARAATPLLAAVRELFKTTLRVDDGTWSHDAIHAFYRMQHDQPLTVARARVAALEAVAPAEPASPAAPAPPPAPRVEAAP